MKPVNVILSILLALIVFGLLVFATSELLVEKGLKGLLGSIRNLLRFGT